MARDLNVFVRQKDTDKYLSKDARWVGKVDDALIFGATVDALEFCRRHSVKGAEVVLRMGSPKYDIVLKVD